MKRQIYFYFFTMPFSNTATALVIAVFSTLFLAASTYAGGAGHGHDHGNSHASDQHDEPVKGPNGGRLLMKDGLTLELVLFEDGVPPEFHVYLTQKGKPVAPETASVTIILKRLGGIEDRIRFTPQGKYLRGDLEIYEPHSFEVEIQANVQGKTVAWNYENFEGRVKIAQAIADSMGVATDIAGKSTLDVLVRAYGRVISPPGAHQAVTARFPGVVKKVHVELGSQVSAGDTLLTIESNESLRNYSVKAPISGIVDELYTSAGMNTQGETLLTLLNTAKSVIELDIFSSDRTKVHKGQHVTVFLQGEHTPLQGSVSFVGSELKTNQSFPVRVTIPTNSAYTTGPSAQLLPGTFARAEIAVAQYDVALAVKRQALQSFRDFTVVYAKVGETYEVRMLDLGRQAGEWIEVLGGLDEGTEYVTDNSFLIKADIEKSGASHDH